jgi:hypothetical protein
MIKLKRDIQVAIFSQVTRCPVAITDYGNRLVWHYRVFFATDEWLLDSAFDSRTSAHAGLAIAMLIIAVKYRLRYTL